MENGQELVAGMPGTTARETFEGQELEAIAETAASAVAAQAQALVQARYTIAQRFPRDWDDVRVRLLKECRRPSLAEVAIYNKPVGGQTISGLSIRFVETALRCMGNTVNEKMTIYDGPRIRIVRVTVCDLESNTSYPADITIEKVVERRNLTDGRIPISSRKNSKGQVTYAVPATEDEMLNKENALTSKAIRTNGLRIIPGDLQDECESALRATMQRKDTEDPDAARRKLADAFAALNVMPSELAKFLGHDLGTASPAEIQELRGTYAAIRDGETTWPAALAAKTGTEAEEAAKPDPKAEALKKKLGDRKGSSAEPAGATETIRNEAQHRNALAPLIEKATALMNATKDAQAAYADLCGEKTLDELDAAELLNLCARLESLRTANTAARAGKVRTTKPEALFGE